MTTKNVAKVVVGITGLILMALFLQGADSGITLTASVKPPVWEYTLKNGSSSVVAGLNIELATSSGVTHESPSGWDVAHFDANRITWQAKSLGSVIQPGGSQIFRLIKPGGSGSVSKEYAIAADDPPLPVFGTIEVPQ